MKENTQRILQVFFRTGVALMLITTVAPQSFADGPASQMGILFGLSVPDADNTNPHQFYGVKGSATITGGLALGGYYLVSGKEQGSDGVKWDLSLHGIEAAYNFGGGSGGNTFMGFRVGLSKVRTTQQDTNVIFSPYHYGLVVGHDYPITTWLSFGFEGSYLHVERASTTPETTTFQIDDSNVMNFMLSLMLRL